MLRRGERGTEIRHVPDDAGTPQSALQSGSDVHYDGRAHHRPIGKPRDFRCLIRRFDSEADCAGKMWMGLDAPKGVAHVFGSNRLRARYACYGNVIHKATGSTEDFVQTGFVGCWRGKT